MQEMNTKTILASIDPQNVFKEMGQMCGPSTNCECKCSDSNSTSKETITEIYESK